MQPLRLPLQGQLRSSSLGSARVHAAVRSYSKDLTETMDDIRSEASLTRASTFLAWTKAYHIWKTSLPWRLLGNWGLRVGVQNPFHTY